MATKHMEVGEAIVALVGTMGALTFAAFIFMWLMLLSTLAGMAVGWVVGLLFEDTILTTLARFGVDTHGLVMWQLGGTLGFVGSFFRGRLEQKIVKEEEE